MSELRSLIREVVGQYRKAQPDELARHVAKQTPVEDITAFYEEALRALIPDVLRGDRNSAMNRIMRAESPSPRSGRGVRSSKLAEIQAHDWATFLEVKIPVQGYTKPMGDCTVDDFDWVIADHCRHAADVNAKIEEYTILRNWIKKHKATTLRQTPELIK